MVLANSHLKGSFCYLYRETVLILLLRVGCVLKGQLPLQFNPQPLTNIGLSEGLAILFLQQKFPSTSILCLNEKHVTDRDAWKEGTSPHTPNST